MSTSLCCSSLFSDPRGASPASSQRRSRPVASRQQCSASLARSSRPRRLRVGSASMGAPKRQPTLSAHHHRRHRSCLYPGSPVRLVLVPPSLQRPLPFACACVPCASRAHAHVRALGRRPHARAAPPSLAPHARRGPLQAQLLPPPCLPRRRHSRQNGARAARRRRHIRCACLPLRCPPCGS